MRIKSSVAVAVALALSSSFSFAQTQNNQPKNADEPIDEVVTIGQRAMLANAIEQQRSADVIKNVITSDAIGNLPDQNVAEAVRRLAGINVLNDQGEGRFISVRGLDPSLNSASVNGTRLPAPESDTRSVALDVIPSELIGSIEVIKSLTPDMDADTLGATIRINTKKAFDKDNEFIKASANVSHSDLSGETTPAFSVDFSQVLSDSFGIAGGISYSERDFSTDNLEMDGWSETDDGLVYAEDVEYRDYDVLRERTGLTLAADFKVSDSTNLYARTLYSQFDDTEERRRLVFALDEPSSGTATTATFLSDDGEIEVERELKDRFESQEIQTFEFGGETTLESWDFDYKISYSKAEEEETDTEDPTLFVAGFEDPGQLGVSFDYSNLEFSPYEIIQGAPEFFDAATYEFDQLDVVQGQAEDEETAFEFNAANTFLFAGGEFTFKTGLKLRQREKSFDVFLQVFDGFDGDYTLADVEGNQSYGLFNINPMPDLGAVRNFNNQNRGAFELNQFDTDVESALEDFTVEEDIFAAYIMGEYSKDKLTVIGGFRLEQTDNNVTANLVEIVEEGGTRDGVLLDEDSVFVTPTSFERDYSKVLPSVNVRYDLEEDVVLRGAVYSSLVRPNMSQLAPRFAVEESGDGEREGEFGNPDLEPFEAINVDLSAEYYFARGSVVQGGFFYKDIDNFIVNVEFESDDPPFNGVYNGVAFDEAVIPQNGDNATVMGLELAYSQVFNNGFLVSVNYTYTDTEGTIDGRDIPLPSASENTYNLIVGYETDRFSTRVSLAYRDEYLDELGGDEESDRWVKDHMQLDITASYDITDNVQLFAKLVNLNDEPFLAFQRGPSADRLLQYEEYSWTGKFGVKATF